MTSFVDHYFFDVVHHFFCATCDHVRLLELEKPILNVKIKIGHQLKLITSGHMVTIYCEPSF